MGKKKTTSMRLDEDLVERAHELGLNVTKVCENALKEAIRKLEAPNNPNNPPNSFLSEGSFTKESSYESLGRVLNPRPPPYQGDALTS